MYSDHPLSTAILYQKPLKPASERALGNTARADFGADLMLTVPLPPLENVLFSTRHTRTPMELETANNPYVQIPA